MAKQVVAIQKKRMTRKRLLVIGTLTSIVLAFVLFSSHGLLSRMRISSEANGLRSTQTQLRHEEDSLRREIKKLQSDTLEIERLARERYGYVRPGEKVFLIRRKDSK